MNSAARKIAWNPVYEDVFAWRQQQLGIFADEPHAAAHAREYYKTNPVAFIEDWCDTFDPRNSGTGNLTTMPFRLFPKQREFIEFLYSCLQEEANGLVEKSRDVGATWLCVAFSVWMFLFIDEVSVGWGSRKAMQVDRLGDMSSIFEKLRRMLRTIPECFRPSDFSEDSMAFMKIYSNATGSSITGESGDDIGRGGRTRIYFKDESAHYEHPESIEAALGDTTRVQIDISSVNGLNNVFHRKREAGLDWAPGQRAVSGRTNVFVFDWSDHPLKTKSWYDKRRQDAVDNGLLHLFAQEVDRDYSAAIDGIIIEAAWVRAAIDAHVVLGFDDSGEWCAALDVADEGMDTNALALRKGVILKDVDEWGERDTGVTARRAVDACRGVVGIMEHLYLQYDCIGVGAGIKAETNRLIEEGLMPRGVSMVPWNAGGEVIDKDKRLIPDDIESPLNGDLFTNIKAQAWFMLARRFERTYRAIRSKAPDATEMERAFTWKPDELISIPSGLRLLRKLEKELSQATKKMGARLKMIVEKAPPGAKSPNIADAVVMAFFPILVRDFFISRSVLEQSRIKTRRR